MTTIAYYEARTHFSEILDEVAKGKTILITRRGKPAAVLTPPPAEAVNDVRKVVDDLLAYRDREKRTLDGLTVRELIEAGRRF